MMHAIKEGRRGQLSFDMTFAILMVILITSMITQYWVSSESSSKIGVMKMGINVVAERIYSDVNGLYNSLEGSGASASILIVLPNGLSHGDANNPYKLKYNASVTNPNNKILIRVNESRGGVAERTLNFDLYCGPGSNLVGGDIGVGGVILLKGCQSEDSPGPTLHCSLCEIT